ncbi:5'/3'-nucleotidase SurE [Pseudonocardia nigra]|uniref:5'/3'-nucleotidase SurE n=1 Tax=Pseudonocardia nigra TaxID=1921578 RepID=UPI001C5F567E|nr:5'/3'-nucleotidase SurE [Pseudonocardia nigra]
MAAGSAAVLQAGPAAAGGQEQPTPGSLAGLQVLLTNDDSAQGRDTERGTDGEGLYELRKALCAAGADVVAVAPWSQQSGASGRITTPGSRPQPVTVQAVDAPAAYTGDCAGAPSGGAVYGVCVGAQPCTETSPSASPADAVSVALSRMIPDNYWPDGPDVVLSGINFGQNVGELVNHSGTVGAAVTAREFGVPSLAFSAEVSFEDLTATPFEQTASFAVPALAKLRERNLLTPGLTLNINHPFLGAGEQLGEPVYAAVGTASDIELAYEGEVARNGGTYELVIGEPSEETVRNADTTALEQNDIPITPLDGDWGSSATHGPLRALIAGW